MASKRKLNVDNLKLTFEDLGFAVKTAEVKEDNENLYVFEWNSPDAEKDPDAVASDSMQAAMGLCLGAEFVTRNQTIMEKGEPVILRRYRAEIPFGTDGDLREFFIKVVDKYKEIYSSIAPVLPVRASSYNQPMRKVRPPI